MTDAAHRRTVPVADGMAIAASALAVYALLGQSRFYLFDAETFYMLVARGELSHPNHPLYLPICAGVAQVLGVFGISLFDAMTFASALGSAIFVFAAHRASACLGLDRASAAGAALLCASRATTSPPPSAPSSLMIESCLWRVGKSHSGPQVQSAFWVKPVWYASQFNF